MMPKSYLQTKSVLIDLDETFSYPSRRLRL
jgi:hypothetical protein